MIDLNFVKNFNELLIANRHTIVCAESITAGLFASTIASVSGASTVLKGSIVTYDVDLKAKILGVPIEIINKHSAESQETTNAMLRGLKVIYPNATIHIAVTGVASPPSTDYMITREVGQIYVTLCIGGKDYQYDTIIQFTAETDDKRNGIRQGTVIFIMDRILELI